MTSILLVIARFWRNQFKWDYLSIKFLLNFCGIFKIYIKFWTVPKKKMSLLAYVYPKLKNAKEVVS